MMTKRTMIDPPSGWRYGFPKVLPKDFPEDKSVVEWLIEEGYLEEEVFTGMVVRCWEEEDE